MKPFRSGNLAATAASLILFALLCASVAYWAMQLTARRSPLAPAEVIADPRANLDLASAGRLFGSAPGAAAVVAQVSNIQVLGLAASDLRGSAVLMVDGKSARPYIVGEEIVTGTRLVAIKPDAAVIERGGQRIELPAPVRPSLSVLTSGQAGSSSASAAPAGFAPRPMPGAAPRPGPPSSAAAIPPASIAGQPPTSASGMPDPRLYPPPGGMPQPGASAQAGVPAQVGNPMPNPMTPAPNLGQSPGAMPATAAMPAAQPALTGQAPGQPAAP